MLYVSSRVSIVLWYKLYKFQPKQHLLKLFSRCTVHLKDARTLGSHLEP
jgi:hypothetical protein